MLKANRIGSAHYEQYLDQDAEYRVIGLSWHLDQEVDLAQANQAAEDITTVEP